MYKLWNRCMFCNPEYPDISWYAKYLHLNYITKNYHIEQKIPPGAANTGRATQKNPLE